MNEGVALGIARDADLGQAMVRRQRREQRHRVRELPGRLARVAGNDENVANAGRFQRIEDLAQLDAVTNQARREVRDGAIAEPAEARGEHDRGRQAASGGGGDGERDLFRDVGGDQLHDAVGGKDLVARRAA